MTCDGGAWRSLTGILGGCEAVEKVERILCELDKEPCHSAFQLVQRLPWCDGIVLNHATLLQVVALAAGVQEVGELGGGVLAFKSFELRPRRVPSS